MSELEAIESAVSHLAPAEFKKFRAWFDDYCARVWDAQLERDVTAGKLDRLAEAALAAHAAGQTREL
jgi:hypothetical protein